MKHHLFSQPVLTFLYQKKPFQIETDASDYAIGAFLTLQRNAMAYHIDTLSHTIQKYPTYDKEMYSIV